MFVYDEKKDVLYILAILMGLFDADERFEHDNVYQAILVYPALARLEHFYSHHIRYINLVGPNILQEEDCMHTSKRLAFDRGNSQDSGIHSNSLRSSIASPTSPQAVCIPISASTPERNAGVCAGPIVTPHILRQPETVEHHTPTLIQPAADTSDSNPHISTPQDTVSESRIPLPQRHHPLNLSIDRTHRSNTIQRRSSGSKIPQSATSSSTGTTATTASVSNSPTNHGPVPTPSRHSPQLRDGR